MSSTLAEPQILRFLLSLTTSMHKHRAFHGPRHDSYVNLIQGANLVHPRTAQESAAFQLLPKSVAMRVLMTFVCFLVLPPHVSFNLRGAMSAPWHAAMSAAALSRTITLLSLQMNFDQWHGSIEPRLERPTKGGCFAQRQLNELPFSDTRHDFRRSWILVSLFDDGGS